MDWGRRSSRLGPHSRYVSSRPFYRDSLRVPSDLPLTPKLWGVYVARRPDFGRRPNLARLTDSASCASTSVPAEKPTGWLLTALELERPIQVRGLMLKNPDPSVAEPPALRP